MAPAAPEGQGDTPNPKRSSANALGRDSDVYSPTTTPDTFLYARTGPRPLVLWTDRLRSGRATRLQ